MGGYRKEKKIVFWDMDGVLFPFNPCATEEELLTSEFYSNADPVLHMWMTARELKHNRRIEQFILSAYLNTDAMNGKNQALDKNFGDVFPEDHRIFVPYHTGKVGYAESMLGRALDKNCILLDDHTPNCLAWQKAGGMAIKVLNDINDKSKRWKGLKLSRTGEIIPPKTVVDMKPVVDDIIYAIYDRALQDLSSIRSGIDIPGESEEGIRRWFSRSEYGVDGEKVLAAFDQVSARKKLFA